MLDVNLSGLIGQPEVSEFLRGIISRGRYANAYLFHGPAGVGKGTAALAFARAALCERGAGAAPPADDGASLFGDAPAAVATGDDACGECRACRTSLRLAHPDLKFVFPVSGEEKELDETILETMEAMREDPLHVFRYEKAASIRISQTRELLGELAYRPHSAARRIVVMRDCDRMREDQFSALLKSIEEPGVATVWVLTTSRLSRVPVTIRSRCQKVRFAPIAESLILDTLVAQTDADPVSGRILAALAGGSLARALSMADADPPLSEQRDQAIAMLTPALEGKPAALWDAIQKATGFNKVGREALRQMIEFHQLWLRDILRARYGASPDSLVNHDRADTILRLARGLDAAEIRRRLMITEEALRSIDGNISTDLTLFSTLSRIAGRRIGEGQWPAHATARWDV
jgi:DNA polymerase-3 subunit delta'